MTVKQTGPVDVRPNTLRDQTAPNTFRSPAGSRVVGRPDLNRGGGNAGPGSRLARPQLPLWVYLVAAVIAAFVAVFLLNGIP